MNEARQYRESAGLDDKPARAGRKQAKVGDDGRTNTAFRLKPEVYEQLAKAADEREVSMNWLVNRAIVDFLGRLIPVEEIKWTKN